MFDPDRIRERLAAQAARVVSAPLGDVQHAAVALLVVAPPGGPTELLFIERAQRAGDTWSGHVAFPGGRRALGEELARTAARETEEEVGVALDAPLARLDDHDARTGRRRFPLIVTPFVWILPERPALRFNHEVADAFFAPLERLVHPDAATRHRVPIAGGVALLPAVRHDRFVIWGMTHRILDGFLRRLGARLPELDAP